MENIFKLIEFTDTLDPIYYTVNTEIGSSVWSDTYRTVIELREKQMFLGTSHHNK